MKSALGGVWDYYPFGMVMPMNNSSVVVNSASYRYGYNGGGEKDDEIYGIGNAISTEFRENDPRLGGRWWSTDLVVKAWESPYVGYSNNPIYFSDPSGLTPDGDGAVQVPNEANGNTTVTKEGSDYVVTASKKQTKGATGATGTGTTTKSGGAVGAVGTGGSSGGMVVPNPNYGNGTASKIATATAGAAFTVGEYPTVPTEVAAGILITVAAGATVWDGLMNPPNIVIPIPGSMAPPVTIPYAGHGNNDDNSNPHIVYSIYAVGAIGTQPMVLKYGISDQYRYDEDRPQAQIPKLQAKYGAMGYTVSYTVLFKVPDRKIAKSVELGLVTAHKLKYGTASLPEQFRPIPK